MKRLRYLLPIILYAIILNHVIAGGLDFLDPTTDEEKREYQKKLKKQQEKEQKSYIQNSEGITIHNVTLEEFMASRKPYKNRPKPTDMVFDKAKAKAYILSLPKELRAAELDRFNNVRKARAHVIRIMERTPYFGKAGMLIRKEVKLKKIKIKKRSRRSRSTRHKSTYTSPALKKINAPGEFNRYPLGVKLANDTILILKKAGKGRTKYIYRVQWNQLAFEQWIAFFSYYANMRKDIEAGLNKTTDIKYTAASDYLLLSLLCDWFGWYEDSLKYGKLAVKISPRIEIELNSLLLRDVKKLKK